MDRGTERPMVIGSLSMDSPSSGSSRLGLKDNANFAALYRFTAQMLLIFLVFGAAVYGLTYGDPKTRDIWLVLISTITGLGLPSPKLSLKPKP